MRLLCSVPPRRLSMLVSKVGRQIIGFPFSDELGKNNLVLAFDSIPDVVTSRTVASRTNELSPDGLF